jgi:hypothetical protein
MSTFIFNKHILNHQIIIHISFILVKNNTRYFVEVNFDRKQDIIKILHFNANVLIIEFD